MTEDYYNKYGCVKNNTIYRCSYCGAKPKAKCGFSKEKQTKNRS